MGCGLCDKPTLFPDLLGLSVVKSAETFQKSSTARGGDTEGAGDMVGVPEGRRGRDDGVSEQPSNIPYSNQQHPVSRGLIV